MKVHIQKKHKSKNLQLDQLSQQNEQGHVNKPTSSQTWLGLTVQVVVGHVLDSCERLRTFLSIMLVISSYSGTSRIYSRDINSNRNVENSV